MTLYRKYRPQTLAEVTGQDHIVNVLQAAVAQDRVAHAYLFAGPRGTGKTSVARILAKAVNCLSQERQATSDERQVGAEDALGSSPKLQIPCNVCDNCVAIDKGSFLDVLEVDAASNGRVEEARQLIEQVATAPAMGGYKVYILDEVHMLSNAAFNALLKTLEEPPAKVVFVLCTTESHKVPVTIVSRCQRLVFNRASVEQVRHQLQKVAEAEEIQIDEGAISLVAELADGGYRDALMLLEQLATSEIGAKKGGLNRQMVIDQLGLAREDVVEAICQAMVAHKVDEVIELTESLLSQGGSAQALNQALIEWWRRRLMVATNSGLAVKLFGEVAVEAMKSSAMAVSARQATEVLQHLLALQQVVAGKDGLALQVALVDLAATSGDGRRATSDEEGEAVKSEPVSVVVAPPTTSSPQPSVASEPLSQPPADVVGEAFSDERRATSDKRDEGLSPVASRSSLDSQAVAVPVNAPAELLEAWGKILVELNQQSRSLAAILRDCTPLSYDGTILLLQFWYEFHKKQIELDKNRKLLEKVSSQVLGQSVKVRGQLGDLTKRPRRRAMSEEDIHNVEPVEADASELLDAASKIFGGEIS